MYKNGEKRKKGGFDGQRRCSVGGIRRNHAGAGDWNE
jgi:hypothetical protein